MRLVRFTMKLHLELDHGVVKAASESMVPHLQVWLVAIEATTLLADALFLHVTTRFSFLKGNLYSYNIFQMNLTTLIGVG